MTKQLAWQMTVTYSRFSPAVGHRVDGAVTFTVFAVDLAGATMAVFAEFKREQRLWPPEWRVEISRIEPGAALRGL